MKKLFFLIILFYSSCLFSSEIDNLEIEGYKIGESLKNYLSEEHILSHINLTKSHYNYLNDDFGEVYIFENLKKYKHISFFVRTDDYDYKIYAITGSIEYDNDLLNCLKEQKRISKKYSGLYKNAEKKEYEADFPFDPSGESTTYNIAFFFDNGDSIAINCTKYKKELKDQNNWVDTFQMQISKKEVMDWFDNPIE